MYHLIFLALIGGAFAQFCDNSNCEQVCIEIVDGYVCSCYENYDLQEDGYSCVTEQQEALDRSYEGCFKENSTDRDIEYPMWTRTDNTIQSCIQTCRNRGFHYAGLQGGNGCWCTSNYQRKWGEVDECESTCTGSSGTKCGGATSNSVYRVSRDHRYMGCYFEDPVDRDLEEVQWDVSARRSASDCIIECSRAQKNFAGVSLGGTCACGDSYGKHGLAGENWCMTDCVGGYANQGCGGNSSNSIYRIERAQDQRIPEDQPSAFAEIPLDFFYRYPHQSGIITNRFLMYASDVVNMPYEDEACYAGDCYGVCGTIQHPEGLQRSVSDVTIRAFRIAISEIDALVNKENEYLERVHVHAQTLVVDQTTTFSGYSVLIRARQVIINYSQNPSVIFDHNGPSFSSMFDLDEAVYTGVPSDLTFQKISFLCARMLLAETDDRSNSLGWAIIDDMIRDNVYTPEQASYQDAMRSYHSQFSSIGRNDLHWAPYYTQQTYTESLTIFFDQISLFKEIFDDMVDDAYECETFVDRSRDLLGIWFQSAILEGETILRHAEDSLETSESTYQKIYTNFNVSRDELAVAAENFEEGLIAWAQKELAKAIFGFMVAMVKLAFGIFPCGAKGLLEDLGTMKRNIELLEVTMENLAETVHELEEFLLITDSIMASNDFERYMDNVEMVAALYPMIVEWDVLTTEIRIIFEEELFYEVSGAREFEIACYDFINWAKALTKSVVEYANNIRRYVTAKAMDENRKQAMARINEMITAIDTGECYLLDQAVVEFAEMNYDIMYECNEQLIQFNEAYFYERLEQVPPSARPEFSANLFDLLIRLQYAIFYSDSFSRFSTTNHTVYIQDDNDAPSDCKDSDVCPIKKFRESRTLQVQLNPNDPGFEGLDLFMIERIFLRIEGAETVDNNIQDLRLVVEASGPFINRRSGTEYEFLTRALANLAHSYSLETGDTRLFTELYNDNDGMIFHVTPYTTWLISIHPDYTHIDLSNVDRVLFIMEGPYLNLKKQIA